MLHAVRIPILSLLTFALLAALIPAVGYSESPQDPTGRPPDRRRPTRRTPARAEPEPFTVILTVMSDPGVSIYIDGEAKGQTNDEGKVVFEKLPLRHYSVEARKEGYVSQVKGFQAGVDSPTLVFKLEPDFALVTAEFDSLIAAGKLTGPESPNALEFTEKVSTQYPDRPEVARMRGVLSVKLVESYAGTIERTVSDWGGVGRDEIESAMGAALTAQSLKEEDTRVQAQAAYLRGVLAYRDWEAAGAAQPEAGSEGGSGLTTARTELERAAQLEGEWAPARYRLAVVMMKLGDYEGAEAQLIKTIQLEPGWLAAHNELGAAYIERRKHREAIEQYKRVLSMDATNVTAYSGMGLAKALRGDTKDGVKDIERAMKLDPARSLPHFNLGIIYSQSRRSRERERAATELRTALQKNGDNREFPNHVAEQLLTGLQKRR